MRRQKVTKPKKKNVDFIESPIFSPKGMAKKENTKPEHNQGTRPLDKQGMPDKRPKLSVSD